MSLKDSELKNVLTSALYHELGDRLDAVESQESVVVSTRNALRQSEATLAVRKGAVDVVREEIKRRDLDK